MARRPHVSEHQLRAAAKIAREFGVTITIEPEGKATISPRSAKKIEDEDLDRELAEFKRQHGYS